MGIYIGTREVRNIYVYKPRLPVEYQEVERIGRNGNNYIDTERIPAPSKWYEVKVGFKPNSMGKRYAILSGYSNNYTSFQWTISLEVTAANKARFWSQKSWSTLAWDYTTTNTLTAGVFNDIVWKLNPSTKLSSMELNGVVTNNSTVYTGTDGTLSCYMFTDRQPRWTIFTESSSISYCEIYEWGEKVRDFVPCYRIADGKIWFYEIVNGVFYTNLWATTFSKGNDVNLRRIKHAYIWNNMIFTDVGES